jgi:hypothetical protein
MAKVKVFLSWSGGRSKRVAKELSKWLSVIIPEIEIFYSDEIPGGKMWSREVIHALEESEFAILCVTRTNQDSPWLNFEAGSLWKRSEGGVQVFPLLINLNRRELSGPISLFQAKSLNRREVKKLCKILAAKTEIDKERLDSNFKTTWLGFFNKIKDELE